MQCDLLPATVKLRLLDEGDCVEATCARHYACWHKTCFRQSLHSTKINWVIKHATASQNDNIASKTSSDGESAAKRARVTRNSSGSVTVTFSEICFFL